MDAEFDELKREFLAEAGGKLSEIEGLAQSQEASSMDRIVYLAHQLKGAGGSYGFEKISDEAAKIEQACEARIKGEAGDLAQHVRALSEEITLRTRELSVV